MAWADSRIGHVFQCPLCSPNHLWFVFPSLFVRGCVLIILFDETPSPSGSPRLYWMEVCVGGDKSVSLCHTPKTGVWAYQSEACLRTQEYSRSTTSYQRFVLSFFLWPIDIGHFETDFELQQVERAKGIKWDLWYEPWKPMRNKDCVPFEYASIFSLLYPVDYLSFPLAYGMPCFFWYSNQILYAKTSFAACIFNTPPRRLTTNRGRVSGQPDARVALKHLPTSSLLPPSNYFFTMSILQTPITKMCMCSNLPSFLYVYKHSQAQPAFCFSSQHPASGNVG